jgi:hypothetical protein
MKNDTGAPSTLKRLEAHEAGAEQQVIRIKDSLAAMRDLLVPNADKETQETLKAQIDSLQRELEGAYDLWFKLSKQVREFDKSVKLERREGEKIGVTEAAEIFAQYDLSLELALESYIITIAQAAALCQSPEEFHKAHAETLRSTRLMAIEAAKREGVIPNWLT